MATMLWGEGCVKKFHFRTGDHFYKVRVRLECDEDGEEQIIAEGGSHQYWDGPDGPYYHSGFTYILTRHDFPGAVAWNHYYENDDAMRHHLATPRYREFQTFEEFVSELREWGVLPDEGK